MNPTNLAARIAASFVAQEGSDHWGRPTSFWLKTAADQVVAGPFLSRGAAIQAQIDARRRAWDELP